MSADKNEIDKFFKSSFENAELKPSENIWLGLETKLLNEQRERDRKKIFYLRWLAAACIGLLISFGLFYKLSETSKSNISVKDLSAENKVQRIPSEKTNNIDNASAINKEITKNKQDEIAPANEHNANVKVVTDEDKVQMTSLEKIKNISNSTAINKTIIQNKKEEIASANEHSANLSTKEEKAEKNKSHNNNNNNLVDNSLVEKYKNKKEIINDLSNNSIDSIANEQLIIKDEILFNKNNVAINKLTENENNSIVPANTYKNADRQNNILEKDSVKNNLEKDDLVKNKIAEKADSTPLVATVDSSAHLIADQTLNSKPIQHINEYVKKHHWWAELTYSPDYSYQHFVTTSDYRSNESVTQIKSTYEHYAKPKYGYTTGIQFGYKLNEKWNFQTGIMYAENGERTSDALYIDSPNNGGGTITALSNSTTGYDNLVSLYSTGAANTNTTTHQFTTNEKQTVNYKYEYINIPFLISNYIGKSNFNFHASIGASANFFYRYRIVVNDKNFQNRDVINGNSSPFKKVYYSAIISAGVEYKISPKLSFHIDPTFRYGITSIVKNIPINGFLYSTGIATGIRYSF